MLPSMPKGEIVGNLAKMICQGCHLWQHIACIKRANDNMRFCILRLIKLSSVVKENSEQSQRLFWHASLEVLEHVRS